MSIDDDTSPYYITTAIPYVNAAPHLGFALELVQADVLARYYRQIGRDVRFLSGTDDNSLKNARAAVEQGVPVEELVRSNADEFQELRQWLRLSYDDFIRTSSDQRHVPGVHKLWAACEERGDLYKARYSGLYCVGCEQYYRESDLAHGVCPEHQKIPETVEEENYFFRLSKYQSTLLRMIESGELALQTLAMPRDTNSNGDIFGGWVLSQMDLAGAVPAAARARGRIATVAVEAMRFHKPVFVGDLVSCYARIVREGTTSITVVS